MRGGFLRAFQDAPVYRTATIIPQIAFLTVGIDHFIAFLEYDFPETALIEGDLDIYVQVYHPMDVAVSSSREATIAGAMTQT